MKTSRNTRILDPRHVYSRREKIWPFIRRRLQTLSDPQDFLRILGLPITDDTRELSKLKDIHRGRQAFLIGNGPSVRIEDLEKFKDQLTFCFNRFYLAYDRMDFRPTYTLAADPQFIQDFSSEFLAFSEGGGEIHCYA